MSTGRLIDRGVDRIFSHRPSSEHTCEALTQTSMRGLNLLAIRETFLLTSVSLPFCPIEFCSKCPVVTAGDGLALE